MFDFDFLIIPFLTILSGISIATFVTGFIAGYKIKPKNFLWSLSIILFLIILGGLAYGSGYGFTLADLADVISYLFFIIYLVAFPFTGLVLGYYFSIVNRSQISKTEIKPIKQSVLIGIIISLIVLGESLLNLFDII